MKIAYNGMVSLEDAIASGKPIFDWTKGEPTGRAFDHCTKSDLEILKIYLTPEEQEALIVAFEKAAYWRGVKPLYSFEMIKHLRFHNQHE